MDKAEKAFMVFHYERSRFLLGPDLNCSTNSSPSLSWYQLAPKWRKIGSQTNFSRLGWLKGNEYETLSFCLVIAGLGSIY